MIDKALQFPPYLQQANVEHLKKAARLWGGDYKYRKADCITLISKGLANPAKVRQVIANLEPYERIALAITKRMGGIIGIKALGLALRASGVSIPVSPYHDQLKEVVRPLVEKGLFLCNSTWGLFSLDGYGGDEVFSDYRLLEEVEEFQCQPLSPLAAPSPPASIIRQGAVVSLELIGILQAIENIGGLNLTKSRTIRVNDLRKLSKSLKWQHEKITIDGLEFPDPSSAFVSTLCHADWLILEDEERLVLNSSIEEFANLSYSQQINPLLWGFQKVEDWQEGLFSSWVNQENYANMRVALLLVLKSLPVESDNFWTLDELDRILYDRIGRYFSLHGGSRYRFTSVGKNPEQDHKQKAQLEQKQRQEWLKTERPWLERALTTWLYFLGIVEIGLKSGKPVSFRLTPLGKQVLHSQLTSEVLDDFITSQPAWLVQPNFEIVVYLNATNSQQLAFLERHAQRVKIEAHVAIYQLNRESVYQALEKGSSLENLLEQLQAGSSVPLPQNVAIDIRSWGQLREEISLYQQAQLLEFPDAQARQEVLAKGRVKGECLGDRFLLLAEAVTLPKTLVQQRIDYGKKLPPCLSVTEQGKIQLTTTPDFLLPDYLDKWAERQSEKTWQLTPESIKKVIQAGGIINELLSLLEDRSTHSTPKYLALALKGWAGKFKKVELANVVVLHCPDAEVFELIADHSNFKNYWLGKLANGIFLVDQSQVKAVKTKLAQLGIGISEDLKIDK